MPDSKTKKIISIEDFILSLTANNDEFGQRKAYFEKIGIQRVNIIDMKPPEILSSYFTPSINPMSETLVVLSNIQVANITSFSDISISNDNDFCFLFINSNIPKLSFSNNLNNITHHNSIWLYNTEIAELYFKNFKLIELKIKYSKISHLKIDDNSNLQVLTCYDETNIVSLNIDRNAIIDFIHFKDSKLGHFMSMYSTIDNITLENTTTQSLRFNQTISKDIYLSNSSIEYLIFDELCTIYHLRTFYSKIKTINSNYANIIQKIFFDKSQIENINFLMPCPSDDFYIKDCKIDILNINSITFNKLSLIKSTFQEVLFSHCIFILAKFDSIKSSVINVEQSKIYELVLGSNMSKDNIILLSQIGCFSLKLNYFSSVLGFLFIRKLDIITYEQVINYRNSNLDSEVESIDKNLGFEEKRKRSFSNNSNSVNNSRIRTIDELLKRYQKPTLILNQSSLGKAEFTDCDLVNFDFQFNNSKITEIFISGGSVPSENIQIYNVEQNSLAWHEQKVSAYSQLKKVFDSQGDIFWSSHFQSKTGKHQSKVLELRLQQEANHAKSWNDKVTNLFSTNRFDWISFQLNHYSNLHGENWGRALAFTLLLPVFLYILYLVTVGRIFLFDKPINWNLIGYYFSFLDPTHKIEFLEESKNLNGWARFVDFLSRIVISYGIYQLIVAFRKHGKKT